MRAFLPLLALLAGCGGCASVNPVVETQIHYVALSFEDGECSATAIDADKILTADHCLTSPLVTANGNMVHVAATLRDGNDHAILTLAGIRFDSWAPINRKGLKQGERVRWIGGPQDIGPGVYREGVVARVDKERTLLQAPAWFGDSGAGVFNDKGELVGMVSEIRGPRSTFPAGFVLAGLYPFGEFR